MRLGITRGVSLLPRQSSGFAFSSRKLERVAGKSLEIWSEQPVDQRVFRYSITAIRFSLVSLSPKVCPPLPRPGWVVS
jgi:hypothetical protein